MVKPRVNLVLIRVRIPKVLETHPDPYSRQSKSPGHRRAYAPGCMCFRATNLFCGPIELSDTAGRRVPLAKPEVNCPRAYPATLSIDAVRFDAPRLHLGSPAVLCLGRDNQLASFDLRDYFKTIEPGEYRLTIRPIMYKRVSEGADLCQRIDFPPVTTVLKLAGGGP
jgi:hypothetical protein